MKDTKLIVILVVCMLVAVLFGSLTSLGATSTSKAAVGGQPSGQETTAPLNPAWLAYQKNRTAGKAVTTTTAKGYSLGHIPGPVDLSYLKGKRVAGAAHTYAASYDLRTLGKVTSVKNQNPYGTCWAFATFASLESYLLTPETRNFSEYNLAMTSGFDLDPLDGGGDHFMSTAYLARWGGPVNEVDDPYPGGDVHLAGSNAYTMQKHAQDVYFLPNRASSTDNDNIKWALTTYGGADVAFYWDDAYYSSSPATFYNPDTTYSNHEVTIVGWDDNFAASNFRGYAGAPPGNGAFIVKNSWGTSWGDGGYFYLSYYDTSLQDVTTYTAQPTSNYAAVYQYDPLGWVSSSGFDSTTAWAGNVFTADSSAKPLTAVSFYTTDVNTQYQVYIYTDPTSGPIGGTQHAGPAGTIALPGYHSVKLTTPVSLSSGQKFSVVVKFTTSGYLYPLSWEYAKAGYSSAATASPGQGYVSSDGTGWTDATVFTSTRSMCIKAFTGTSGGSWGPWTNLGGGILAGTSPAAYSSGGTPGWFVVGTNHNLYWSTGGSWTNLGGYVSSSPGATSPSSGVIDVGVRGSNGALYTRHYSGGSWGAWTNKGGQILAGTSPAAYSSGGTPGWFVVGTNHALYWSTGGSWTNLGGYVSSSPAATSPSGGVIDVFVRGSNGALYTRHYSGGSWGAWTSLGGVLPAGTSPAASSWGASREDVFVQGTTGAVYQRTWTGSAWSSWANLGGVVTSSPAATSPSSGAIDLFARGSNGALYEKIYTGG